MGVLNVALLQMSGCGFDMAANLTKGEAFCRRAAVAGADVALLPEMWSHGYTFPDISDEAALSEWAATAVNEDSSYFQHFQALAVELEIAVAFTYLQHWLGAPRNAVSIIDRTGVVQLTYAKAHCCDFGSERACTPGNAFPVCAIETNAGPVRLGAMICFDREFPEVARALMLGGAEIILTPNACTLEEHRLGQFKARAFENMVGVAMTSYAAPQANGHSVAYDCMIVDRPDGVTRSTLIVEAGSAEGVYMAPFDLDALRLYRSQEVWGDAFRRPELYRELLREGVTPGFERDAARRQV